MTETMPNREKQDDSQSFALIGLIIALIAFSMSVTTPWLLSHFSPPSPPIEDLAIEKALSIKEKITAAMTGAEKPETKPPAKNPVHWTDYWSLIVILVALGGIINGAVGLIKHHNRWIGGTAIGFGIGAIMAQYMIIALAAVIFILFVGVILNSLGLDF